MKKTLKIAIATLACFTIGSSYAADVERGVVKVPQDISKLPEKSIVEQFRNNYVPRLSPENRKERDNEYSPQAAAPGISLFEVEAVYSTQYGTWEFFNQYQTSTLENHGGAELYAAVVQIGYGNPTNAVFNGGQYSHFFSERLCGFDYHSCNPGEIVRAWRYYYNLSGQQQGYFTASANSIASPFGFWSDSMYIK